MDRDRELYERSIAFLEEFMEDIRDVGLERERRIDIIVLCIEVKEACRVV